MQMQIQQIMQLIYNYLTSQIHHNVWFPPFHCCSAVAVLPLPLRKFRKNYLNDVRITLLMWKKSVAPLLFPPARHYCHSIATGSNPIFCRSAIAGQPISVLVISSLCIRKDVSNISVLTCNGNGSYGTEERQRYNGTAQRHNGTAMAERKRNGGNQASVSSGYTYNVIINKHVPV